MEPDFTKMTATEFERGNTILWGALIAGCIMISIVLSSMQYQDPSFYDYENFYRSPFMWFASFMALIGYYFGNLLYKRKATEGAKLSTLNEKIIEFRGSFILKAALIEGPTLISIIFLMIDQNVYFLCIAAILLIAQYLNRPTNERFFNDFKLTSAQKQEFLART